MAVQNVNNSGIRRTAKEVKDYRQWMRILPISIGVLALLLIVAYVVSVLYMKFGAFTVMVNKFDNLDYALTLSDSPEFTSATSRLTVDIDEVVTNISEDMLPDWLDNVDGEHNGENYVAYTFYCRNAGIKPITYTYEMYVANMTKDVEKAVRVRLYVDGEYVNYAFPRTDGGSGPEPGTTAFADAKTIVKQEVKHFQPGDTTKFTVVIWLEGNDPECLNNILGGIFKIDMAMNVLYGEDENGQSVIDKKA